VPSGWILPEDRQPFGNLIIINKVNTALSGFHLVHTIWRDELRRTRAVLTDETQQGEGIAWGN